MNFSTNFSTTNRRALLAALCAAAATILPQAGIPQTARLEPYKIGVTYPLTGPLAPSAKLSLIGAEQAVDDINKAGGVKGHPLQLLVEDTQGGPEGGVAAMRKLVQVNGVQAILTIYTNVVTAQIPLADQLKIPTLSTVESPGLVSKSQYSFAHSQTIANEAPLFREYWKAAGYKKLAALFANNALGQLIQPVVKAAAQDNGIDYTEAFFDLNASDYRGIVAKVKEYNPDAIFISAQGSTAETTMIKQLRELGVNAQMFSPSNTYNEASWRSAVGPYADGVMFAGLHLDEDLSRDFIRAYQARAGVHPTYIAAEVYDIIQMYAFAIGRAGYNGEAIRNVLATMKDVRSVMGGTIVMGPDHYSLNGGISLWKPQNGKLVKILPRR